MLRTLQKEGFGLLQGNVIPVSRAISTCVYLGPLRGRRGSRPLMNAPGESLADSDCPVRRMVRIYHRIRDHPSRAYQIQIAKFSMEKYRVLRNSYTGPVDVIRQTVSRHGVAGLGVALIRRFGNGSCLLYMFWSLRMAFTEAQP